MSAALGRRRHRAAVSGVVLLAAALFITLLAAAFAPAPAWAASEPHVGDSHIFFAYDWGNNNVIQVKGEVRAVGERCIVYVQEGRLSPAVLLQDLVREYDTNVHPRVTAALGAIPDPGVDGESRVVILLYGFGDSAVLGSFFRADLMPEGSTALQDEMATSNHKDMFYLNLDVMLTQPDKAASTAAHELAHLIVFHRDFMLDPSPGREPEGDEARWLEEGLAMYAELVAGFPEQAQQHLFSFQMSPNKNLTYWDGEPVDYGANYAFVTYMIDRLGPDLAAQLVNQPKDGVAGINAVLAARGAYETFSMLFDDWVLADFLDSRPPALWPFSYQQIHVFAEPMLLPDELPVVNLGRVQNYGAAYLDIPGVAADATTTVMAVVDGDDGAPLRAALLSWDSTGLRQPSVSFLQLASGYTGGWTVSPAGYDRHTLAVWSRGTPGAAASYGFRYSVGVDAPGGVQFLDVGADHRFFYSIEDLLARGIVNGKEIPAGSGLWYFQPDELVLRAQFAKMIMEATGLHTPEVDASATPTFRDVPLTLDNEGQPKPYPFDYVEEAAAAGIVGGYSDGRFASWEPIRRIQLVRMILRGAAAAGKPLPAYTGSEPVFADVPPGSDLYADVMTAYQAGIMDGAPLGGKRYFMPWSSASRGQVAKMTSNLIESLEQ